MQPEDVSYRYPIDIENAAEMARLIDQDRLFTEAMGGLLPEYVDLPAHARILDLACGAGGWALNMAFAFPECEVAGVDNSQTMIRYANANAKAQKRQNASFEVMDIVHPLDFSPHTFDLVNARFIVGFMSPQTWPSLLAECFRVLKPGGTLCLTECETGISNSAAFQQLNGALYRALHTQHRTYSVDGHSIGIVPMLVPLLRTAGFQQIKKRPFLLDASYDEPLYYQSCKEMEVTYALLKPYLVQSGVIADDVFDTCYKQTLIDMYQATFVCTSFGLTVSGRKPHLSKEPE